VAIFMEVWGFCCATAMTVFALVWHFSPHRIPPANKRNAPPSCTPPGSLRWYLAQQYVANPMLLPGRRKFGVRLWVLVSGLRPLRVYAHRNGLVLLANSPYDAAAVAPYSSTSTNTTGKGGAVRQMALIVCLFG
jgi:hypothetical protein